MKAFLRIGAATAGAALVLGAALPAQAASTAASASTAPTTAASAPASGPARGVAFARSLVTARIEGRLGTLSALSIAVTDSKYLTKAHKSDLEAQIKSDWTGLTALKATVAGATTVAALRADNTAMIDDYRVYLLLMRQVRLTDALDRESAAATTLQKAYTTLSGMLSKAGGGTSTEQSELADLQTQINAAQSAINGQATTLLALKPGPDAAAITGSIKQVLSAAKSARTDLKQARTDAKDLRAALK